jgi:cell division protein FtsW
MSAPTRRPPTRRPPTPPWRRALQRLDGVRARGSTPEFTLLAATVAVLSVLGLVMTFSASFVQSTLDTGDAFALFTRQLQWSALGVPVMVAAAAVDHRTWRRIALPLLLLSLGLAVLVLVPGVGVMVNGARRWLDFGPARFQPSELLKLTVPLYLAHALTRRWPQLRAGDLHALLLPALPVMLAAAGLVLAGPDLETAVLIVVVGGIALYVAGLPTRIVVAGAGATFVAALVAIATSDFRRGRIAAWLDPLSDPTNYGYQTLQGYLALGSGGWFGVGLGQGRGKWLYIPNAHTDFIFAIIGEELGLVGALFVLSLFAALAVAGIRTARRAPDPFGRLLAAAITGWLLLQAAINMGSVVGLLPVTGVTLPLVSFGGSSLVITMLALGMLMSIARAGTPSGAAADDRPVGRDRPAGGGTGHRSGGGTGGGSGGGTGGGTGGGRRR